jgi:hypothetical protein
MYRTDQPAGTYNVSGAFPNVTLSAGLRIVYCVTQTKTKMIVTSALGSFERTFTSYAATWPGNTYVSMMDGSAGRMTMHECRIYPHGFRRML